jgi:uncharacterized SAM-binding protein YcdF (DUF218 family)
MALFSTKLASTILLPPLSFLLIGIVGLIVIRNRPLLGKALIGSMILLLWVFSMPAVGTQLIISLETRHPPSSTVLHQAKAIVVLTGNQEATLRRLRSAAKLYRATHLPILVSGGDPADSGLAGATDMQQVLEKEYQIPVSWVEPYAANTQQNAAFSSKILRANGIDTVFLVTHAWHMPRAKLLFEQQGIRIVEAGTGHHIHDKLSVLDFLPDAGALANSQLFLHEKLGLLRAKLTGPSPAS